MIMYCPDHNTENTVMLLDRITWFRKDGKLVDALYQFKCPVCGATIRTELPITYYKEGKL